MLYVHRIYVCLYLFIYFTLFVLYLYTSEIHPIFSHMPWTKVSVKNDKHVLIGTTLRVRRPLKEAASCCTLAVHWSCVCLHKQWWGLVKGICCFDKQIQLWPPYCECLFQDVAKGCWLLTMCLPEWRMHCETLLLRRGNCATFTLNV